MKLLTRFREEFTPQAQHHADVNRAQLKSNAKSKTSKKQSLSRLTQDPTAIMSSMKISLR
mgnify:CR=1 FL=1